MILENHETAKRNLAELENEARYLPINLSAAIKASEAKEIARLKQREKEIESELFSARVLHLQTLIEAREMQSLETRERLTQAKLNSQEIDKVSAVELKILNDARTQINNKALSALALPGRIEIELRRLRDEIDLIKKELNQLISS
jgi:hypothetical protein